MKDKMHGFGAYVTHTGEIIEGIFKEDNYLGPVN